MILDKDIIKQDEKYYLSNIYEDEEYIAKRIKYLTNLEDNKIKNLSNLSVKLGGKDKKKYDNLLAARSAIEEGQLNLVKSLKENIQHNIESAQKNNIEKEATALLNLNMFEKMDANKKFFGIK